MFSLASLCEVSQVKNLSKKEYVREKPERLNQSIQKGEDMF